MTNDTAPDLKIAFKTVNEDLPRRQCHLCGVAITLGEVIIGLQDEWARLWMGCQSCAENRTPASSDSRPL